MFYSFSTPGVFWITASWQGRSHEDGSSILGRVDLGVSLIGRVMSFPLPRDCFRLIPPRGSYLDRSLYGPNRGPLFGKGNCGSDMSRLIALRRFIPRPRRLSLTTGARRVRPCLGLTFQGHLVSIAWPLGQRGETLRAGKKDSNGFFFPAENAHEIYYKFYGKCNRLHFQGIDKKNCPFRGGSIRKIFRFLFRQNQ